MSARRMAALAGSVRALATRFRDGEVEFEALAALASRRIAAGTVGIVACVSTGEAPALTQQEQAVTVRCVVLTAGELVPVIAGASGASTSASCALADAAARDGANGLLAPPPPYIRPTQEAIVAHVGVVAHAADPPITLC